MNGPLLSIRRKFILFLVFVRSHYRTAFLSSGHTCLVTDKKLSEYFIYLCLLLVYITGLLVRKWTTHFIELFLLPLHIRLILHDSSLGEPPDNVAFVEVTMGG